MVEIIPKEVDLAFLYFHAAGSTGDEIAPYIEEFKKELPTAYIWAGDGFISGDPFVGKDLKYATGSSRFWFAFPMQDASSSQSFADNIEPMGAVLVSCGAYINAMVDQIMLRYGIPATRVILGGFRHGSCAALAAAMIRKNDPYALTVVIDPFPLETYYLKNETKLPSTKVACIDNQWTRERNKKWLGLEIDKVFASYGVNAQRITIENGRDVLDENMIRETIRCIKSGVK